MDFQNLSIIAQIYCIDPKFNGWYVICNFVDQINGFILLNNQFFDAFKIQYEAVSNTLMTLLFI
jgi:hypothetical protein